MPADPATHTMVLERCKEALPGWAELSVDNVDFDDPKGFSSFTMGVRPRILVEPDAVLYRHLEDKENAILDTASEREVFLLLGSHDIAAHCHHYARTHRIEQFHHGRTLTAEDLFDPATNAKIAAQLFRLHQLSPSGLPGDTFFTLLHRKWGPMARRVLVDERSRFPAEEQRQCEDLLEMLDDAVAAMVQRCLPDGPPVFCHNDTYHGNVMLLDDGRVKLLDFEFSCLNHISFDFANLFAETKMQHGLAEPPHFRINPSQVTDAVLGAFVQAYLDCGPAMTTDRREAEVAKLVFETRQAMMVSDYMYAMAALPLALEPIQRIRFLPYAHQRFALFRQQWDQTFSQ